MKQWIVDECDKCEKVKFSGRLVIVYQSGGVRQVKHEHTTYTAEPPKEVKVKEY